MASNENFSVNFLGEDLLLEALKRKDFSLCLEELKKGRDPFIPSPFGQCAGGLVQLWSKEMKKFVESKGGFNDLYFSSGISGENPRKSQELLAYTLPRLSGIHLGAARNDLEQIKKCSKNVNERDAWGYQPIVYAMGNGHLQAMQKLMSLGSMVNIKQGCLKLDKREILSPGFYNFDIESRQIGVYPSDPLQSPLLKALTIHQAAASGAFEMLKTLIDIGVPVDIESYNGSTPLICAAMYGQWDICDYLIECGASPEKVNFIGESAEEFLRRRGNAGNFPVFSGQCTQARKIVRNHNEKEKFLEMSEEGETEVAEVSESVNYDVVLKQFKNAATKGDFQTMVVAYSCLNEEKAKEIPKDFVDTLQLLPNVDNKEMIVSWLLVNGVGQGKHLLEFRYNSEMTEEIMAASSEPEVFLRYMKDGRSISFENKSLRAAVSCRNLKLFRWLLRHGATTFTFKEKGEPYRHLLEEKLKERREIVQTEPTSISNELLFALTTFNFELLLEYVSLGLNWREARTEYDLQLQDLSKMDSSGTLAEMLRRLSNGETPEEIVKEIPLMGQLASGSRELEVISEDRTAFTSPSDSLFREEEDPTSTFSDKEAFQEARKEGIPQTNTAFSSDVTTELTGADLSWTDSDDEFQNDDEDESIAVLNASAEIDSSNCNYHVSYTRMIPMDQEELALVKGYLYSLPVPRIVVDQFLLLQDVCEDEKLMEIAKDTASIELYRAFKLYADDKIAQKRRQTEKLEKEC